VEEDSIKSVMEKNSLLREILEKMPADIRERSLYNTVPARRFTAKKGEPVHFVDILCEGEMRVLNEFDNGNIYSFALLKPVTYVGSYEVIARREEYCSTIETVTVCSFIRMLREDFFRWFRKDPWFTIQTSYRMACDICDQSWKHGEVLYYPSEFVVGDYLIRTYDDLEGETVRIPYGRQEMGDRLGLSVRTVNRCIKVLKDEGLVNIEKGKIRLDRAQHARLCRKIEEIKSTL